MDRAVVILRHLETAEQARKEASLVTLPCGATESEYDSDEDGDSNKETNGDGEVAYAGEVEVQVAYNAETKEFDLLSFSHLSHRHFTRLVFLLVPLSDIFSLQLRDWRSPTSTLFRSRLLLHHPGN